MLNDHWIHLGIVMILAEDGMKEGQDCKWTNLATP